MSGRARAAPSAKKHDKQEWQRLIELRQQHEQELAVKNRVLTQYREVLREACRATLAWSELQLTAARRGDVAAGLLALGARMTSLRQAVEQVTREDPLVDMHPK